MNHVIKVFRITRNIQVGFLEQVELISAEKWPSIPGAELEISDLMFASAYRPKATFRQSVQIQFLCISDGNQI